MIPIRVRQFPEFVRQAIIRARVLSRPNPGERVFHLCFFSCHSHFSYLYCSLHSLVRHVHSVPFKVKIFSDEDQPLSGDQIQIVRNLIPAAEVISWPKSVGWGATQIGSIWRAYSHAAQSAADDDIIAKVDSDVFFFNETIFQAVARSDADLVGDGHFVDFKYVQGGCYFFRASAVRKITAMFEKEPLEGLVNQLDDAAEDMAAYHFAKRLGLKIWLTWFMVFPDEMKNSGGLTSWLRWKFSCAHFIMRNKTAMLDAYEGEVLQDSRPDDYLRAVGRA